MITLAILCNYIADVHMILFDERFTDIKGPLYGYNKYIVLAEIFCFDSTHFIMYISMKETVQYNVLYCQETPVYKSNFIKIYLTEIFYNCEPENLKIFWDQWSHGAIHFLPLN